jgi:5'-deoxynucleotidase YfbR-like HD superfamily hydrolase
MNLTINDRLRLQLIERWHMAPVYPTQTVASHSYAVGVIADAIAARMGLSVEERGRISLMAANHDALESLTGDIPSPAKRYLQDRGIDINHEFAMMLSIPPDDENSMEYRVTKTADRIETAAYMMNYGIGKIGRDLGAILYEELDLRLQEMQQDASLCLLGSAARIVWQDIDEGKHTFL